MITLLILLVALGVLGWGFYRARPFGKLGILAWLQSVVLMAPWLIFFGLFSLGIYLNLAVVLLLLVASIGLYVFLGSRLRAMGQDPTVQQQIARTSQAQASEGKPEPTTDATPPTPPVADTAELTPPTNAPVAADQNATDMTKMPAEDLAALQGIFGIDTFFVTETIPYQEGAIFKGNLRGDPESTYSRLSSHLRERLGDRYNLFLVAGPEDRPTVVVLPSSNAPKATTVPQFILAVVLAIATLLTCAQATGFLLGFDLLQQPDRFVQTLPITLGIVTVLAAHELGHRWLAHRHQVKLSPPFFLPTLQIGSFGALTRFESLLPNRSVLFDVAFAGPAAGGIVALGMVCLGLVLSHPGSLFQIPSGFFQGSILVGTLARVVLGDALQQPLVDVHPLLVVGWLGLVITAINLMPAGALDGGRIVQAIYGRRTAGRTTVATIILLGIVSFVNQLALYWAIVILFLQRDLERPAFNELSEPDDARAALGLLALFLMAATLLPLTPSLAGRLGIGG